MKRYHLVRLEELNPAKNQITESRNIAPEPIKLIDLQGGVVMQNDHKLFGFSIKCANKEIIKK